MERLQQTVATAGRGHMQQAGSTERDGDRERGRERDTEREREREGDRERERQRQTGCSQIIDGLKPMTAWLRWARALCSATALC